MPATSILSGKSALVTGAGRGIGRAIALRLAELGVRVAIVSRSSQELSETAAQVRAAGGVCEVVRADLSDAEEVSRLVGRGGQVLGAVDILVNNAAVVDPLGPVLAATSEEWSTALNLNVIAPAMLSAGFAPGMVERGWGRIANVSSGVVARSAPMVGLNVYAATKAALEAHTTNLAAELTGSGVTVNVFRPGMVDTTMQERIRSQDPYEMGEEAHRYFTNSFESGSLIRPESSAKALVASLATDATGEIWSAPRT